MHDFTDDFLGRLSAKSAEAAPRARSKQLLKIGLDVASALFAALAAYFWFQSARTDVPAPVAYFDYTPESDPFLQAFRKATRQNRLAALCAGASALFAAASTLSGDLGIQF